MGPLAKFPRFAELDRFRQAYPEAPAAPSDSQPALLQPGGCGYPPPLAVRGGCALMDETPTDGFRHRPLWLVGVAGLLLAQAGLALALFGPDRSPGPLLDERPVTAGRHPLHQYHGALG